MARVDVESMIVLKGDGHETGYAIGMGDVSWSGVAHWNMNGNGDWAGDGGGVVSVAVIGEGDESEDGNGFGEIVMDNAREQNFKVLAALTGAEGLTLAQGDGLNVQG